ncbi:integrase catalytic domain-containing protein [Trichonephila clavata]|uniref:Integrase catalytic domain-containing protein n=1 Tax=Trichonephila clavata TaxID=2740835 RepID=A0A8X6L574_TRICU|nr:integrase catalytic domain-containing protein [Trichonephila clavata]
MSELRSLEEKIENHVPESKFENVITSSQEYQEKIVSVQGKIQRLLNRKLNCERRSEADNNEIKETVIVKSSENRMMNLPRLQIETFYGDSCKWLDFWNQFEITIHGNDDMRKTEKFAYLKSLLGGNALSSISGFAISDQNYDSSIEILKERFGRTHIVISSHMNKLLAIEPIRNISYLKGLLKLYDECEIQIRSLNSLNVTSGSYGNLLCPIILQKISEELNLEFNRYRKTDTEFQIEELMDFLKREANCREAANLVNKNNQHDHLKYNCNSVNCIQKREFLRKTGRCYLCFGQKHRSTDCNSKSNCVKCRGKHHESICFQRDLNSEKREEKEQNETISVSQNNSSRKESSVILQTVNALAIGREKKCFVKCLLDARSQISAIREDLSISLNLRVKGERELNIYTFGEKNCKRNKCKIIELTLRNINNPEKKITFELMEVPTITTAEIRVPEKIIKQQLGHQGICFIECSVEKCEPEIGILIGADVLWSITSSEIKRINKSCVAIETAFGWCLPGTFRNEEPLTCVFMNVTLQLTVDLDKSVKSFWEQESIGMNETNDSSSESEKALQIFDYTDAALLILL